MTYDEFKREYEETHSEPESSDDKSLSEDKSQSLDWAKEAYARLKEQQNKIFDFVIKNLDKNPIVIDAIDLVSNPKKILQQVCKRLKINFTTKMLSWPKGPRASDGLWGEYWYKNVWKTTSFIKKYSINNIFKYQVIKV